MSIIGCFADRQIGLLSLLVLGICLSPSSLAQEASIPQSSPVPKFSLKVSHDERAVLGKESQPQAPQFGPGPILPQAAALPAGMALPPALRQQLEAAKMRAMQAMPAAPDKPNSYLEEYNVSWQPWVAALASAWYSNLRFHEESYGIEFHTARPALIQFTCYADGHIGNVALRQSSGIPVYDQLQIAALMQTAPLAPFPRGTAKSSITLIQGWESHRKRPGESDFQPFNFAGHYPQEKVTRWAKTQ